LGGRGREQGEEGKEKGGKRKRERKREGVWNSVSHTYWGVRGHSLTHRFLLQP